MKKRNFLALLLGIVLICALCVPAAAQSMGESAPEPLTFTVSDEENAGLVILGLDVARQPIPADTILPLIQSVTSKDARYAEDTPELRAAATGLGVIWESDGRELDAAVVVRGDVLGTGMLDLTQLARMAAAFSGAEPLTGPQLIAADVTGDAPGFDLTDIVFEAKMLSYVPAIGLNAAAEICAKAADLQAGDGSSYSADVFHAVQLHAGDIIYGMLPGQSAFYTDAATVEACGGSYVTMYGKLQMLPHPEFGYREQLGAYRVKEDMWVASGYCLANSEIDGEFAGAGGGFQYVIPDYENALELTETTDLHE